ncbi:MAG: phage terminase large subunit family protein [Candidatus Competibacteraceae bacterium]
MANPASCAQIMQGAAEILRPPRRVPVVDAVEENMRIYLPGGSNEFWNRARTPYMVEPMNRLADRRVEGVVFVGPSRSGKTAALVDGFLVYAVICDPGDMHIIHMTQATAQRYSQTRIDRLNQHSPEMKIRLSPYASDDNVYAKRYRNSMTLSIGWPSITQLSSFDIRYVALTDYDRFPEDVGREGDVFTPARKRTQTFMSSGRVLVESSPGKVLNDAKWQPKNPHEGPPCGGIFALYNQGDRKRWYWPCPHCHEFFTAAPSPDAFTVSDGRACLTCTVCGATIDASHKPVLNATGVWLADGQTIAADRTISGDAPLSNLASYWLTGAAAAYQSWDSLLQRYQQAYSTMERTGDEKPMQALITTDFGTAYRPRNLNVLRDGRILASRAEAYEKRTIPAGVCYLTAAVDVQKERFVVQVMGWGIGGERWLIDRYNLRWSRRLGGNGEPEPIDPARQLGDWAMLLDQVACKPYPFANDAGKGLIPVVVAVDSGGKAGVTERAYAFWKQARSVGLGARIMLVKGDARHTGPRLTRTFPDSTGRTDRKANAAGEVPVWLLNTLILKDSLAADLERTQTGPGYLHFPDWLGPWFYDELAAETRTAKGWENLSNDRNEAFDLCVYNHAAMLLVRGDSIHWEKPPAWADPMRSAVGIALIGDGEPAPVAPHLKPVAPKPRPTRRESGSWGL